MKRILLLLFVLINYSVNAQECEYEKNEKDDFTGKTIKQTKEQTVYNIHSLNSNNTCQVNFSLFKINSNKALCVYFSKRWVELFCYDKNTTLSIKLLNDSIVILNNAIDKMECSKGNFNQGYTDHYATLMFKLTDNDFLTLSSSPMVKLRFKFMDVVYDVDVQDNVKKTIGSPAIKGKKGYNGQSYFIENLKCIE